MKSFGRHSGLVLLLAWVGGSVDAIGFLTLGGLFVSHMSGNSAAMGAFLGQGDWLRGLPHLFAVPVFVLGLFCGYFLTAKSRTGRTVSALLAVEAALLCVFLVMRLGFGSAAPDSLFFFLLAVPPLLAMGLQNSTLRRLGNATVHTTYVTGVLDAFAESSARAVQGYSSAGARPSETAVACAMTWGCYAVGALLGSFALMFVGVWALVPAIGILVFSSARLWFETGELP